MRCRAVWVRACRAWRTLKSTWKSAGIGCRKPLASSEALPIRPACSSGSAPKPALLNEAISSANEGAALLLAVSLALVVSGKGSPSLG